MADDNSAIPPAEQVRLGSLQNLQDIWLHDYAQKAEMLRASMAKGLQLGPGFVRPFPGSTPNTVILAGSPTPVVDPPAASAASPADATATGTLAKLALAASLLGGGGLAGAGAMSAVSAILDRAGQAPATVANVEPGPEREWKISYWVENGEPRTKVEPVTPAEIKAK